jgi:hypothetical protein
MLRILLLLSIVSASCAQQPNSWKKFKVNPSVDYKIDHEDQVYVSDFEEPNDTITASVEIINENRHFSTIELSEATLVSDTLKITLYTTTSAYHHEYNIFVVNDKYLIKYRFAGGGGIFDEILVPIETTLRLDSKQFKRGSIIRGFTEFKTKCISPCSKGEFIAKGNFKIKVK